MSMSESVTEFSEVFPPLFPPPPSSSVGVGGGGGVVVVLIVVPMFSPPSYPVFHRSLNVVNECCMKSLRHFAGSVPIGRS